MLRVTRFCLVCAWILALTPSLWAQQEEPVDASQEQAQAPPAYEPGASATLAPDTRPLSGAEELRAESSAGARNFVVPSLRISAFGDTNRTILATGQRAMEMTGSIVGGLAVHRKNRRHDFALDYTGGGIFYARNSELNATIHQLGITERYKGRRWGLTLGDQLSFLPESSFGFGGFGPSLGLGGSPGSLNPALLSSQSLFSGGGDRISNTAVAQIDYSASARSTFTFGGTYGILRFHEPGFVESSSVFGTTGYNYAATRRDTISISYGFGAIRFVGSDLHLDNHYMTLAYGRRVTGKLAFSISGGPQFIIRRIPAIGSERTTDLFAHTSLDYNTGRTGLGWSYAHFTSNGSGIFQGAKTDRVQVSVNRRITRNWGWSIGPGYSRNARLGGSSGTAGDFVFNSIHGSTSFQRKLGRYTDLSFSYNIYRQWSDASSVTGTIRSSSFLRHFFGIGVTWHGQTVGLD